MGTKQPHASQGAQSEQGSNLRFPYADLLRDIKGEWNKAEEAIKRSEQIALDVAIPAIAELRYAGRRLVDALDLSFSGSDEVKVRALLEDARFCCHRAQHDAIDAAMAKIGIDLDDLTSRLGFEAIVDAYPEFREFYAEFTVAREKIAASRSDRQNRNAIYDAITAVNLPDLAKRYERVMAVRPLAKRSALRRRLGSVNGLLLVLLAIIGAIFAGLAVPWEKYLGKEPTMTRSATPQSAPQSPPAQ